MATAESPFASYEVLEVSVLPAIALLPIAIVFVEYERVFVPKPIAFS